MSRKDVREGWKEGKGTKELSECLSVGWGGDRKRGDLGGNLKSDDLGEGRTEAELRGDLKLSNSNANGLG